MSPTADPGPVTLFLCGDVMTGRGVDQILPHPVPSDIHEPVMTSAYGYVELAERESGEIPDPVDWEYPWGDARGVLDELSPDARIINLETAVTLSESWVPKGINYRMHPENVPVLGALAPDVCVVSNNHVLDWGEEGLLETLATLEAAGFEAPGAGRTLEEADRPAALEVGGEGRVLVFAFGSTDSGIPPGWAATMEEPGVNLLPDYSDLTLQTLADRIRMERRPADRVVVSIHWGGNWGYEIPDEHRTFARGLVDAGVDVVHGHSSHHPRAVEVYRGRPILYGCGDFINDYEGIGGRERFRSEIVLMYFATLDGGVGGLRRFEMRPMRIRRIRLEHPSEEDVEWIHRTMDRECGRFGADVRREGDRTLVLEP